MAKLRNIPWGPRRAMMGISWMELMVIAVVALIVIGPKDLPAALRTLGRSLRTARRMAGEFQSQIDQLVRDSEIDTVRRDVDDALRGVDEKQPSTAGRRTPEMPPAVSPASVQEEPQQAQIGTEPRSGPGKEGRS